MEPGEMLGTRHSALGTRRDEALDETEVVDHSLRRDAMTEDPTDSLSRRRLIGALAALGIGGRAALTDLTPAGTGRRLTDRLREPGLAPPSAECRVPSAETEVLPPKSVEYLKGVSARIEGWKPRDLAAHVKRLGEADADWRRRKCISLRAAEGIMGAGAQRVLNSSTATRVSEGYPGAKSGSGEGTDRYIDEVEGTIIHLAQRLFRAQYVEWRSISNTMANALPLLALTEPDDAVLSQAMGPGGGNAAYHERGPGGFKRLVFHDLPYRGEYEVDLGAARDLAKKVRPKLIFVGGSFVIFPYPVRELREIADEVGAVLVYDAAHLALLIAGGAYQRPLDEGAHILTMSTHKSFGGPVGGLTLTNDAGLAAKMIRRTLNGFLQTRDANKLVAAAYSFAEVAEFGAAQAAQIVKNAKALAESLDRSEGFTVLGRGRGYTTTHQVIVDVRQTGAEPVIQACLRCNILLQGARIPGDTDRPSALRLSVAELTRLGMTEAEMPKVGRFIRRAVNGEPSGPIAAEIERFLAPFQTVRFAFDV